MNENAKIFDDFVTQLKKWGEGGTTPDICSLDLNYAFELQRKRLEEKNLSIKYTYTKRFEDTDTYVFKGWGDKEYDNKIAALSYDRVKEFLINGKSKFKDKEQELLYTIITWMRNQQSDKTYCCPNCGAIHSIRTLLNEGCPNCKTRFIMSDLFPKVTNYYSVKDYGESKKTIKDKIKVYVLTGFVIGFVCMIVSSMIKDGSSFDFATLLTGVPGGVIGAFAGYVVWAIGKICSIFTDAAKSIPKLARQHDAKSKLPQFMLQFDPNFSFEYFIGKIIAMARIMIFCSDYSNLAIYEGPAMENQNKDIVDVQYNGAVKLNSYSVKGAYCYLDIVVYTTDTYCVGKSIRKKNEAFRMVLCKNVMNPPDYGFSVGKVQCKNCGASFDATREHNCPYCNSAYHLGDDDWVVLVFHKA